MKSSPNHQLQIYTPIWRPEVSTEPLVQIAEQVLLFVRDDSFGKAIADLYRQHVQQVIVISLLSSQEQVVTDVAHRVASGKNELMELVANLSLKDQLPDHIIFGWGVIDEEENNSAATSRFRTEVISPLHTLIKSIELIDRSCQRSLTLLTHRSYGIGQSEIPGPVASPLVAVNQLIPLEFKQWRSQLLDIDATALIPQLVSCSFELQKRQASQLAARRIIRKDQTWVESLGSFPSIASHDRQAMLKQNGVYIITGGFSAGGRSLAQYLAREYHVNLVLVTDEEMPAVVNAQDTKYIKQLGFVQDLEDLGAQVTIIGADLTREEEVGEMIAKTVNDYGKIDGVFHLEYDDAAISLQELKEAEMSKTRSVRQEGTWHLYQHLLTENPDFLLLFGKLDLFTLPESNLLSLAGDAFGYSFSSYANRKGFLNTRIVYSNDWDLRDGIEEELQAKKTRGQQEKNCPQEHFFNMLPNLLAQDHSQLIVMQSGAIALADEQTGMAQEG